MDHFWHFPGKKGKDLSSGRGDRRRRSKWKSGGREAFGGSAFKGTQKSIEGKKRQVLYPIMITTITVLERLWYITDPGGMLLYTIIGSYGNYCISELSN